MTGNPTPPLRDEIGAYLRAMKNMGFIAFPQIKAEAQPEPEPEPPQEPSQAASPSQPAPQAAPDSLEAIAAEIALCRKCVLCKERKNTVPGEGAIDAKLVFVGEGPGYDEDRVGRPFVGKAGALLTKMIDAMKFSREDVFIVNVVKCHPPQNRDPLPEEIQACEGYLLRQLDVLKPKIIVTMGRYATQCLLNTSESISRLRGQWREYHGIRLMPIFHPAYLLRNPSGKHETWEDLQKVIAEYEREVGPPPGEVF